MYIKYLFLVIEITNCIINQFSRHSYILEVDAIITALAHSYIILLDKLKEIMYWQTPRYSITSAYS